MNLIWQIIIARELSLKQKNEGGNKVCTLFKALKAYCEFRMRQNDYTDAMAFAEQFYNLVAEAYNPVHPEVQTAAGTFIECLFNKCDLEHAQIFAQMTLNSLRDPVYGVSKGIL